MKAVGTVLILVAATTAGALRLASDVPMPATEPPQHSPLGSAAAPDAPAPPGPAVAMAPSERAEAPACRAARSAVPRSLRVESSAGIAIDAAGVALAAPGEVPAGDSFRLLALDGAGRLELPAAHCGGVPWIRADGHASQAVVGESDVVRLEPVSLLVLRGATASRAIRDVIVADAGAGSIACGATGPDTWACAWDPGAGDRRGGRLNLALRDGTQLGIALADRTGVAAAVDLGLLPAVAALPLELRFVRADGAPAAGVLGRIGPALAALAADRPPVARLEFDGGAVEAFGPDLGCRDVDGTGSVLEVGALPIGRSYRVEARSADGLWSAIVDPLEHDGSPRTITLVPARSVVGRVDCGSAARPEHGSYRWRGARTEFAGRFAVAADGSFRLAVDPAWEAFEDFRMAQGVTLAFPRYQPVERSVSFGEQAIIDLGPLALCAQAPLATIRPGHGIELADLGIEGAASTQDALGSLDLLARDGGRGIAIADAAWLPSGALELYALAGETLTDAERQPGCAALLDCGESIPLVAVDGGGFRRVPAAAWRVEFDIGDVPEGAELVIETAWPAPDAPFGDVARVDPAAWRRVVPIEFEAPAERAWLTWTLQSAGAGSGGDPLATGSVALAPGLARVAVP